MTRSPSRNAVPLHGAAVGVEPRAQRLVERVDAGRAAVHRRPAPGRRRPGRGRSGRAGASTASETHLGEDALRRVALDEEEVADVVGSPALGRRRLAAVDRVGGADDQRARGLAEDLGQPRRRARRPRRSGPPARGPGPTGASWSTSPTSSTCVRGADGLQQRGGQAHVEHRGLVDDEQVDAGQRVVGVAREALAGHVLQQPVDRRRLGAPVASRQPPRRLAGRRAQPHACAAGRASRSTSARIVAVLPVPGSPVRIDSRCSAAACTAAHCVAVGARRRPSGGSSGTSTLERRRRGGQLAHALGQAPLGAVHRAAPGRASPSSDQLGVLDVARRRVSAGSSSSRARARQQLGARQEAVAVLLGGAQRVGQRGVDALGRVGAACRARAPPRRRSRSRSRRPWPARRGPPAAARARRRPAPCARAPRPRPGRRARRAAAAARGRRPAAARTRTAACSLALPIPGTSRRRVPGSRSTISSTSSPWRSTSHCRARGPTCLTDSSSVSSASVDAGAPTRTCSTWSWRPNWGCSRHAPPTSTVSPSCRCAIGPVSVTSSPSLGPPRARRSRRRRRASAPRRSRRRRDAGSGTRRGYAVRADRSQETRRRWDSWTRRRSSPSRHRRKAKDGTLKERAKELADQAQTKLDEVQTQFNESQRQEGLARRRRPAQAPTRPRRTPAPSAAAAEPRRSRRRRRRQRTAPTSAPSAAAAPATRRRRPLARGRARADRRRPARGLILGQCRRGRAGSHPHRDRHAVRRRSQRRRAGVRRPHAPPRRPRLGRLRRLRHDRRGLDAERRGAPARRRAGRAQNRPEGTSIIAGAGLQRHAPRGPPDRARDRARRRRRPQRHAVLQQAQPARDRRALRGGRPGHRQADHPLQHPVARRHRRPQRPAGRAGADRRTSTTSSRPTTTTWRPIDGLGIYAGNDDVLAAHARASAAAAASASPATSSATRCAAWSTSPSNRADDRRVAARRLRRDGRHHQPDPRQGGAGARSATRSAACACRSSRPTRTSARRSARSSSATACSPRAGAPRRTWPTASFESSRSAGSARSART